MSAVGLSVPVWRLRALQALSLIAGLIAVTVLLAQVERGMLAERWALTLSLAGVLIACVPWPGLSFTARSVALLLTYELTLVVSMRDGVSPTLGGLQVLGAIAAGLLLGRRMVVVMSGLSLLGGLLWAAAFATGSAPDASVVAKLYDMSQPPVMARVVSVAALVSLAAGLGVALVIRRAELALVEEQNLTRQLRLTIAERDEAEARERLHRDARERSEAAVRRSEKDLRDAQAIAHVGSWSVELDSGWWELSEEAYRILGLPAGTAMSLERIVAAATEDERRMVEHAWATPTSLGAVTELEHRLVRGEETRWVRIRAGTEVEHGRPVRRRGTIEDITLARWLNQELDTARQAAEAANRAKSQFLANMSHELRTPLNGMMGMAQVLTDPGIDEGTRIASARTLLDSSQALLTILNDVLDLSRIEAGAVKVNLSPMDPAEAIAAVRSLFQMAAEYRNIAFEAGWDGPVTTVESDSARLRQVLHNLVSNALKFTPPGGRVTVSGRLDGGRLRFVVTDTGPGIAPGKLSRLFLPFSQLDDSDTRTHGGLGLGLAIARSYARLMGGDVHLDTREGQGCTFTVDVPAREVSVRPVTPTSATALPRGLKVLVVEDVEINRRVARALLSRAGAEVDEVSDGRQAIERLTLPHGYDLVFMDCQMPGVDGLEATRAIRAWELAHGARRVPIVALTAGAFETDRDRCVLSGMDDFLTKPLTMRALVETMTRAVEPSARA